MKLGNLGIGTVRGWLHRFVRSFHGDGERLDIMTKQTSTPTSTMSRDDAGVAGARNSSAISAQPHNANVTRFEMTNTRSNGLMSAQRELFWVGAELIVLVVGVSFSLLYLSQAKRDSGILAATVAIAAAATSQSIRAFFTMRAQRPNSY